MKDGANFFQLLRTALSFSLYSFREERRVKRAFYGDPRFTNWDRKLKKLYRWKSPFTISRRFLEKRGAGDVHTYGETPLTSLDAVGKKLELRDSDCFLDLGCGRGRGAIFVSCRFGCRSVGIDYVPEFIETAKSVGSDAEFLLADIAESGAIRDATAIFLAWTCMNDGERAAVEKSLGRASSDCRIATVSSPIESQDFVVYDACELSFPWGDAEVFFHKRAPLR